MPFYRRRRYGRRYRRRYNRRYGRRYKKMRRKKHDKISILKLPMLWPDAVKVPLCFSFQETLTDTSGTVSREMVGNSIYQPYPSSSVRANGWDFWNRVYDRYYVSRSSCKVDIINITDEVGRMYLWCNTYTPGSTAIDTLEETRYIKKRTIGQVPYTNQKGMKNIMSTKKVYGVQPSGVNYASSFSGNPTNLWYWHFVAISTDGVFANPTFRFNLVYYCRLYRSTMTTSTT